MTDPPIDQPAHADAESPPAMERASQPTHICPGCLYPLINPDPASMCPECGASLETALHVDNSEQVTRRRATYESVSCAVIGGLGTGFFLVFILAAAVARLADIAPPLLVFLAISALIWFVGIVCSIVNLAWIADSKRGARLLIFLPPCAACFALFGNDVPSSMTASCFALLFLAPVAVAGASAHSARQALPQLPELSQSTTVLGSIAIWTAVASLCLAALIPFAWVTHAGELLLLLAIACGLLSTVSATLVLNTIRRRLRPVIVMSRRAQAAIER